MCISYILEMVKSYNKLLKKHSPALTNRYKFSP